MKRLLFILSLISIFAIVGCSDESQPPAPNDNHPAQVTTQVNNSVDEQSDDGWKDAQDAANTVMMMSVVIN